MQDPMNLGVQDETMRLQALVTATASLTGPPFDNGAGWAPATPGQPCLGAVLVGAVDLANGTYTVRLQDSDDGVA